MIYHEHGEIMHAPVRISARPTVTISMSAQDHEAQEGRAAYPALSHAPQLYFNINTT